MNNIQFTFPEIIALIGLAQCIYILVYFSFRVGQLTRAALPALYFLVLGIALGMDASYSHLADGFDYYKIYQSFFWFLGPPLSYLLIIQIARITRVPEIRHYWVVALLPAAFAIAMTIAKGLNVCPSLSNCAELSDLLIVAGLVVGAISLLAIWFRRGFLDYVSQQAVMGKERYWLIIALIIVNSVFLGVMLLSLAPNMDHDMTRTVRSILGLAFVYVASTSLFRIYPQAVRLIQKYEMKEDALSDREIDIALKIEKLLHLDKMYHEPSYSRKDMAGELGISEAVLSRIINVHFGKSFPQLLNEHRVADAKRMLAQTDAPVKVISEEVGFNSLASFNRVFKDYSGVTPSQYRDEG